MQKPTSAGDLECRHQEVGRSPAVTEPAKAETPNSAVVRPIVGTIWIAAVFCLFVCGYLLYQHSVAAERDPWKSPQLLALKEKLRAAPADETIKTDIRRLDLEFRQRYVRRLSLNRTGGWLLVGGMAVMLLAAKQTAKLQALAPMPRLKIDAATQARQVSTRSRWSVTVLSAVVVAGLATLAFTTSSPLPESKLELDKLLGRGSPDEAVGGGVSLAEFKANWPRFRGAAAGGVSDQTNLPVSWDEKLGAGIAWKSSVPARGHGSPIVWGNRVFLSGGDEVARFVLCYNAQSGQMLWQRGVTNVPGTPAKQPEISEMTGYASPTMACDGRRVFAIFANGDLAAFTLEGASVWSKNIGVPKNMYGHATSLAIWPGHLIVQLDQDEGAPGGSKLFAFDGTTGRPLWERSKPTHGSWATPIIIEAAGKTQIITLALPHVISYSLTDGNELWRADLLEGEVTPSPIFAGGLVIVVNPSVKLVALRPDGAGDVTKSHIVWTAEDNIPDVTSPASNGELVFTVTSSGVLMCFNAKDGKKVWEKDLEMEVQSSPSIVGDRLLVLGTKGVSVVVEAGRQFKEVARSTLADEFLASPAFAKGRIFLRGKTNLWCLGEKK
ncbi:MAG: PQQ-like beta-propeller repeat protein [Verrucomicrobia bacterium]|nr:PQQ-like beta-propeller repeat protein [Verrucomicrobiota bacterium]